MNYRAFALLFVFVLASCGDRQEQAAMSVSIMTFNVENLFDTNDDPDHDDLTFLPIAAKQSESHIAICMEIEVERWRRQCLDWDWSEEALTIKLERVASVILQVNEGKGPDIVALQEIENIDILERLRTEHLQAAGYHPAILIEGQDRRGIDVAFLTRLELHGEPVLHALTFDDSIPEERVLDTRGVLETTFVLPDGDLLTGFAVHFPAPFHPTVMREFAYRHLNDLRRALPTDRLVFAGGDFNTTSLEDIEQDILGRYVRPSWTVAHEVGCMDCQGTSWYAARQDWSFLDMLLWAPGDNPTWKLDPESVSLPISAPQQSERIDAGIVPNRFETQDLSGISDHFPVLMRLRKSSQQ